MAIFLLWLLFGIGLIIQIVFLFAIFGLVAFGKSKTTITPDSSKQESVTVLITTHNEAGRLKHLIPVLFAQNYQDFDVLIVNDRSNDRTRRLLEDFSEIYPRLQIVTVDYTPDHLSSKKYALTLGVKASKNDVILMTESDCIPQSPDWITKMTSPIRERNKTFSIGFAGYERKTGFLNSWIQFESTLTAMFYLSFKIWKMPFTGVGKNLSYRRSFFMDAKAFKGFWNVIAGDAELFVNQHVNSLNSEIVLEPDTITISRPKTNFRDYLLQKKKYLQAQKHYRKDTKIMTGVYGLSHSIFWIGSLGLMVYIGFQQIWGQLLLVISLTLLRSSVFLIVFSLIRKKIQGTKGFINTFIHDLVYLGYFWLLRYLSHLVKEIKWK